MGGAKVAPPLGRSFPSLALATRPRVGEVWAWLGRARLSPSSPLRPQDPVSRGGSGLMGGTMSDHAPRSRPPPRPSLARGRTGAWSLPVPPHPSPAPAVATLPRWAPLSQPVPLYITARGGMGSGHRLRPAARPDCRGPWWRRRRQQQSFPGGGPGAHPPATVKRWRRK